MSLKPHLNPKTIGMRFRSARSLVPLNRKDFCERHDINRYTMQSWENGLHVSKGKNLEKFISALALEGISCTAEWLIDATGEPARPFAHLAPLNPGRDLSNKYLNQPPAILKTVLSTYQQANSEDPQLLLYKDMITMCVADDSMMPVFRSGDWLLAYNIKDNYAGLHQKYAILELSDKRSVVRKILYFKDYFIAISEDPRIPSFSIPVGGQKIYLVLWHLLSQHL